MVMIQIRFISSVETTFALLSPYPPAGCSQNRHGLKSPQELFTQRIVARSVLLSRAAQRFLYNTLNGQDAAS